ncbi:TPA: hypothetical protein DIU27_02225 [Candidatus Collierbacteria bacterium]|uniref:Uncharacterized protein n=1 Tax=Candidatus Collierbacteria bacterium GW2011_GWB2_44_22 TaxID=1618387 RepID=A0A0G1KVN9_9BACT|nr:MAG: hypothetical protein UW31_C0009G0039 [Candidatus Collierbacteria bacterium GW2011_GWA2_44_13]KKT51208.1 MAG: hypothetical protein UW42_C0005G0016 [Candidatus Collierbacteria bacterium GW2011_GWB1_44_197]KKT51989.1 MAG: hypothetical protein UW44_C0005G0031 [Candidatus Collierbacteria bacterium GW2011_GWB2_44_22]KKT62285.1 MAG: hypothetical protein UW56_C0009G0059 [Candidatus Collierbacteria bacterium GW2011_GWD1_44_27]KKT66631.1 MAG: hypothetical protein UW58_C0005G0027 [Candidatus Colli
MAKKFLYLLALFLLSSRIVFGINSSIFDSDDKQKRLILGTSDSINFETIPNPKEPYIFSALPSFDEQIKTSIKTADARPEIIRQYLHRFGSPLEPYSDLIVILSDQYQFDYRWLVAIAQQESNLCKRIPENSYNCWGWGIYGDKVTRFDNYEDALRRIAPQFTKIFLKGNHTKDPLEVMKTYTPPSDGSWANGVSQFFDHLE